MKIKTMEEEEEEVLIYLYFPTLYIIFMQSPIFPEPHEEEAKTLNSENVAPKNTHPVLSTEEESRPTSGNFYNV